MIAIQLKKPLKRNYYNRDRWFVYSQLVNSSEPLYSAIPDIILINSRQTQTKCFIPLLKLLFKSNLKEKSSEYQEGICM